MQIKKFVEIIVGNNPNAVAQKVTALGLHIDAQQSLAQQIADHADQIADDGTFLSNVLDVPVNPVGLYAKELLTLHMKSANGILVKESFRQNQHSITKPSKTTAKPDNPFLVDMRQVALVAGTLLIIVSTIFLIKRL